MTNPTNQPKQNFSKSDSEHENILANFSRYIVIESLEDAPLSNCLLIVLCPKV